jgi:cobalt-zinc-cadmium efflux system outer membrane protein
VSYLHGVLLALVCLTLGACALPAHFQRPDVAAELACRTGHLLGPERPPCDPAVLDGVDLTDGLSEDEAATLAVLNNPAYQRLLADLQLTRADLIAAREIRNPYVVTMLPVNLKQWELALYVPLDALLLRPRRTEAARFEAARVGVRLVQDGLNTIRDARVAYADLVLAQRRVQLARQGLELQRDVARIAEAQLQAGAIAELDAAALRLQVMFGQQQLVQAERDAGLARERLRFLMGLALSDVQVQPSLAVRPVTVTALDVQALVAEAVASRPDVLSVSQALGAAEERALLARYDFLNVLGLLPDLNSRGLKGFEAGPGLQMNVPIFNWNQGAKARAGAELARLDRQYVELRDTAAMEVRQAAIRLAQAQQELGIWHEQVLPQAESAMTSARKALEEDGTSLLLVLETTRQLLAAQQRELEAAAEIQRAVAELERSVGRRVFEEAPPLEEIVPPLLPEDVP